MNRLSRGMIGAMALLACQAYAQDTIRFGVEATYPPFESKQADGKLVGFDIDLGNAICTQLKAHCVWVENSFDGMIPALKAKKFDGIISSMSITTERLKQISFSDKLFNTPAFLAVKKGSQLKATPEALRGKRVGVQQGSIFETYAKKYWAPRGVTVTTYQSSDLAYADLVSGRLDGVIDDAVVLRDAFLSKPNGQGYEMAGPEIYDAAIFGHGTGIGLRKEDIALRQKLNSAIAAIHRNGTYDKLAKKYFSFNVYGK
jgi:lysine/arginine/ornithine transport system substrate-binding protein/histidine transport system substrate-binding protein